MGEFVTVGRVKDAHGLKGELFITLFAREADWLGKLKEIRLIAKEGDAEAERKTFPLRSVRAHKNGLIALSPGIQGRNAAENLKGWFLEIPRDLLVSEEGEELYLIEIAGFAVHVQGQGEVGVITGFSSNTVQDLLVVTTPKGESYEIPFVEEFVLEIDYDARVIHMELPIGLLGEEVEAVGEE